MKIGQRVLALKAWLAAANIDSGALFRKVDHWGNIGRRRLKPQTANLILKTRAAHAGLDATAYSAKSA